MGFSDFHSDPVSITAALAAIALIFFIIRSRIFYSGKGRRHVVAGTVLDQFFNFHRLHDYRTDLARKNKTHRLVGFTRSEVYTVDPVVVEHMLKTNFKNYVKGWFHYETLTDLLGDGIFAVDGEKWQHQRKASSYEISTKIMKEYSLQVFKSNAVKLAEVLSEAALSNETVDIQDLFMKSTFDSVFKVILGVDLDTLGGAEEGTRFSKAFDDASAIMMYRYVDFFWKIKRFLNIGLEAVLRNRIQAVDEFVYKLIRIKTEQVQNPQDHDLPMRKGDMVSRFLALKETDPKYLRDIILSFMIAGRDTTALTLSWFLYLVCKHPHIQEKIAQEVREATKLKNTCTIEELVDSLTDEALEKMHYLHATLTETIRLYTPVPGDSKLCLSDDTLPDGFNVRKGDTLIYLPYSMGRMKFIWGDDAEEFRPERWLGENGNFQPENSFKFTAFQAGPRICVGKDFAYRQMKTFAAVLSYCYKFKLAVQSESVNTRIMLTLQIDGGLHVHASNRWGPLGVKN